METLINYLKREQAKGVIDFHLRIQPTDDGWHAYIHPQDTGGETFDIYDRLAAGSEPLAEEILSEELNMLFTHSQFSAYKEPLIRAMIRFAEKVNTIKTNTHEHTAE